MCSEQLCSEILNVISKHNRRVKAVSIFIFISPLTALFRVLIRSLYWIYLWIFIIYLQVSRA